MVDPEHVALDGLRVSEAIGADIEVLGLERGHRTLTSLRKGGKAVATPTVVGCYTMTDVDQRFDPDLLGEDEPFEIDEQAAHLFKHPHLGVDDIYDVRGNDPLFYPAKPPAHWLMCAEVDGRVLVVPLAPARDGDPRRCRPIGCYEASVELATRYRRDR